VDGPISATVVCVLGLAICNGPGAQASPTQVECLGNLETGARRIITPGVSYLATYWIDGRKAVVVFAGRQIEAGVSYGSRYSGPWIFRQDEPYLSYLPSETTIKFEFEPDVWFSGSCRLP
jgi:hypothetical protein